MVLQSMQERSGGLESPQECYKDGECLQCNFVFHCINISGRLSLNQLIANELDYSPTEHYEMNGMHSPIEIRNRALMRL